jgi:hypothetical protein
MYILQNGYIKVMLYMLKFADAIFKFILKFHLKFMCACTHRGTSLNKMNNYDVLGNYPAISTIQVLLWNAMFMDLPNIAQGMLQTPHVQNTWVTNG